MFDLIFPRFVVTTLDTFYKINSICKRFQQKLNIKHQMYACAFTQLCCWFFFSGLPFWTAVWIYDFVLFQHFCFCFCFFFLTCCRQSSSTSFSDITNLFLFVFIGLKHFFYQVVHKKQETHFLMVFFFQSKVLFFWWTSSFVFLMNKFFCFFVFAKKSENTEKRKTEEF